MFTRTTKNRTQDGAATLSLADASVVSARFLSGMGKIGLGVNLKPVWPMYLSPGGAQPAM